jgi:methyltransferase
MIAYAVVALVALQRLFELALARRNTRALLAAGAREAAPEQHVWFVVLHAAWLASIAWFADRSAPVSWWLLGVFALLQLGRVWVIRTLGGRWTTRIITLPGAPPVTTGPYRYVKHPNYAIVAAEIAVLPAAFGEWGVAAVFSIANAALLAWRIRAEDRALSGR